MRRPSPPGAPRWPLQKEDTVRFEDYVNYQVWAPDRTERPEDGGSYLVAAFYYLQEALDYVYYVNGKGVGCVLRTIGAPMTRPLISLYPVA